METANGYELAKRLRIPADALNNQAEYINIVRTGISGGVVKRAIEIMGNREMFVRLLSTTSANLNRYYRKKTLNRVDTEEVLILSGYLRRLCISGVMRMPLKPG